MNGSDAPHASTVHKITKPCYITWGSLICLSILAGGASEALMLPSCMGGWSSRLKRATRNIVGHPTPLQRV